MTTFRVNALWSLNGPAARDWFGLVLGHRPEGIWSVPEVIVVPARAHLTLYDVTHHDVICPEDSSPIAQPLVFAAWAVASIPAHCLEREVGVIDPAIVARVREAHGNLEGDPSTWNLRPFRPWRDEPAWHAELRRSLHAYWDGSVIIACGMASEGVMKD